MEMLINTCNHLLKDSETNLRFVFWKYLNVHNLDINITHTLEDRI